MSNRGGIRRVWHFPCKFSHNIAVVTCPCACRLRRLAQNGCRGSFCPAFSSYISTQQGSCDMSMCISTAKRPLLGSLHGDLAKKPLVRRSCQETFHRDLANRARDLVQESCLQRSCQDTSSGDLVRRHCIEICCRDLAKRSLT